MPLRAVTEEKREASARTIQGFFRTYLSEKQKVLQQNIVANPCEQLLQLIDLRFQCMRAVAAAKFPIKKPIEDKEQEARVITAVQQLAIDNGITELEKIDSVFQHQITLSKTVQHYYYDRIWDKTPRDARILVNNAYIQLRALAIQAGFNQSGYSLEARDFQRDEVLGLARDLIKRLNQDIVEMLSDPEKHKLNMVSQDELTVVITKILASYMTPGDLEKSTETIQSLAATLACRL